jgi:hypothetical protein
MCPLRLIAPKDKGGDLGYHEIARTERIDNNLNPEFATKIPLDFFFEEQQGVKFEIYDVDDENTRDLSKQEFLGVLETTLGEIVGSPSGRFIQPLK